MRAILIALLCLSSLVLRCQDNDARRVDSNSHDPRIATLRSAILPGFGQVYNEKYWKVPIIYGGLGASAYFIRRNTKRFKEYRSALVARNKSGVSDPYQGIYNEQQLNTLKETYRRWRDLSYISLFAVYVLQVVDANVDAHLYDFDVSDDLSLRIQPWSGELGKRLSPRSPGNGLTFSLRF